jgi:transcriptional regulator with XRE-family HTH domain
MAPPFNERLKQLREAAGLTQEQLAKASGLSVSAVSKLEQRGIDPSWSTVLRLAQPLGVTVIAFAEDGGPKPAVAATPATGKRTRKQKGV